VDSVEKIEKLLKGKAAEFEDDEFTGWPSADFNCLLIEVLATYVCFDDWLYTETLVHKFSRQNDY